MNFNIEDTTATVLNRVWIAEEYSSVFIGYDSSMGWFMKNIYYDSVTCFTNDSSLENPWDTTTWYYYDSPDDELMSTPVEITVTE